MKRKRFSEEQIIGILRLHQAGAKPAELCRQHGISEATLYNWRSRYGGLQVSEAKRLRSLEEENRDAAERIKALMFTFDDLVKLDTASAQTLMRNLDKDKLAVALKGASEAVRQFFFSNMSSRAGKMLIEDMQAMGPVRLRDVDESQALLVNIAKDLAAKGEILISKSNGEDELIY